MFRRGERRSSRVTKSWRRQSQGRAFHGDTGGSGEDYDQGHPGSWVWIDGFDAEKVHEEFRASGAKIRNPPANYPWALEMQVEDRDGNVHRIGSDPRPGEPIGDWLDINGVRHRPKRAGEQIKQGRESFEDCR